MARRELQAALVVTAALVVGCEDTPAGGFAPAEPVLCAVNERVLRGACVACPAGTTNAAGDDASGADTSCDSTLCGRDEFVLANACRACPEGTDNDAGDDVSGPDTMCEEDACTVALGVSCERFEEAYLKASNTDGFDEFGISVALDGDTLAVGAHREASAATGVNGDQANNSAQDSGAVYVFTRSGTTWRQEAYLKASNTDARDDFGFSVAVDGDTLAVGTRFEDSAATGLNGDQANNDAEDSGAVYVRRIRP